MEASRFSGIFTRKRLRAAAIAAVVILVLIGGLAAFAWSLLDEDLLKRELSKKLGRSVAFSGLSPGLVSIGVENLEVGDTAAFNPDPLLTIKSLDLTWSWRALLRGKFLVNSVTIRDGSMKLEVDTGKISNIDDLLTPPSKDGYLQVEELHFEKVSVAAATPFGEYGFTDLEGAIAGLEKEPVSFDLAMKFADRPLEFAGSYTGSDTRLSFTLKTKKMPLSVFPIPTEEIEVSGLQLDADFTSTLTSESGTLKGEVSIPELATLECDLLANWRDASETEIAIVVGTLSGTADATSLRRIKRAKAQLDELQADGRLKATVRLAGPIGSIPREAEGEFLGFSIKLPGLRERITDLRGGFALSEELFTAKGLSLLVAGSPLRLDGTVGVKSLLLDLGIKGDKVNFGALAGLVEPSPLPAGVEIGGTGSLDVRVKGSTKSPKVTGTVVLKEGGRLKMKDPDVELTAITGTVKLADDVVRFDPLSAHLNSTAISANGTYNVKAESFDMKLVAKNVVLAELPAALDIGALRAAGNASFDGKVSGTLENLRASGTLTSNDLTVYDVRLTDLETVFAYDGQNATVESLKASAFGAPVNGTARASVSEAALPFDLALKGGAFPLPSIAQAVADITAFSNGAITLKEFRLTGKGKNLGTYDGKVVIGYGGVKVAQLDRYQSSFAGLQSILSMVPSAEASSFTSVVSTLGDILSLDKALADLNDGEIAGTIKGGRLHLDRAIRARNSAAGVEFEALGSIGLDGGLDLDCKATLSEETLTKLTGNSRAVKLVAGVLGLGSGGRLVVPFSYSGSLEKSQVKLNIDQKTISRNLAGAAIRNLLGVTEGDTTASPGRRAVDDILNRALGGEPAPAPVAVEGDSAIAAPAPEPAKPTTVDEVIDIFKRIRNR